MRCALCAVRCALCAVREGGGGTVGLEQLDTARLSAVDGGGAERSIVVVHAAAAQLDGLAWLGLGSGLGLGLGLGLGSGLARWSRR